MKTLKNPTPKSLIIASFLSVIPFLSSGVHAAPIVVGGDVADGLVKQFSDDVVDYGVYTGTSDTTSASISSFSDYGYYNFAPEFVFQLPNVGTVANPFTDASLALTVTSVSSPGLTDFTIRGTDRSGAPQIQGNDIYSPSLQGTGPITLGLNTFSGASLLSFLNTSYNSGSGAGSYVYVGIVPTTNINGDSFTVNTADALVGTPTLTLTEAIVAVPEPGTFTLLAAGLGALALGIRRRQIVNR